MGVRPSIPRALAALACVSALTVIATAGAHGARAARAHPLLSRADRHSFALLSAALGGSNGVAVSAIGLSRHQYVTGNLRSGVAWSTIKTAIAIATYDRTNGVPGPIDQGLLQQAITASDNAAAEKLWEKLGGGHHSAAIVQRVLASTGDSTTTVQATVTRPGLSAFGQTVWPITSQLRFMAGMACVPNGIPVIRLMNQVIASQRWGLGSAGRPAQFKGGWGPSPTGPYLVRQIGILNFGSHPVAVTIAAMPADGTFATGTHNLTRIARWLATHVDPAGAPSRPHC